MDLPSHIQNSLDAGARLTLGKPWTTPDGQQWLASVDLRPNGQAFVNAWGHTKEEAIAKLETALRDAEKNSV